MKKEGGESVQHSVSGRRPHQVMFRLRVELEISPAARLGSTLVADRLSLLPHLSLALPGKTTLGNKYFSCQLSGNISAFVLDNYQNHHISNINIIIRMKK